MIWFKKKHIPPDYPDPIAWSHANSEQRDRANRSFSQLKLRSVPCYQGPLFVGSSQEVNVRSNREVACRILILRAVVCKAMGRKKADANMNWDAVGINEFVSPDEQSFLSATHPAPELAQTLVWRVESLLVLLWSVNRIGELSWPSDMCDVDSIMRDLDEVSADTSFIAKTQLRPISELLDQQDLILRIHWAIRDSYLNGRKLPYNLDWQKPNKWVPIEKSPTASVVYERHYALNWLLCFLDAPWDNVDTPT